MRVQVEGDCKGGIGEGIGGGDSRGGIGRGIGEIDSGGRIGEGRLRMRKYEG